MNRYTKYFATGALALASGLAQAQPSSPQPAPSPVVVELFTSQGCSSCPPADALAARLALDPALLVLTRPVTIWDQLGWKDTLARPANTALQAAYARRLNIPDGVYTPQVVVGGQGATVGSLEGNIRALARSARAAPAPALSVKAEAGGGYRLGIAGAGNAPAEVIVLALTSATRVNIGRGENSGNAITYTNVVRDEWRLGSYAGGTHGYAIPAPSLHVAKADRYAVVLRQADGGRILAARMLPVAGG